MRKKMSRTLLIKKIYNLSLSPYLAHVFAFKVSRKKSLASVHKELFSQIDEQNNRIKNARELVADGKIDPDDYRKLKQDCTQKIIVLEAKISCSPTPEKGIEGLLNSAVATLSNLSKLYEGGTITQKQQIIGSIYPEKLIFDGFRYRTTRLNEIVRLIFTLDKGFSKIKTGKTTVFRAFPVR